MTNERAITIDHFNEKTFSDLDVVSKSSSNGHSASDTAEVYEDSRAISLSETEGEKGLPPVHHEEEQHDGGYGWFVVLGAFLVQVTSFGTCTSCNLFKSNSITKIKFLGVMQDYFERHMFNDVANATVNLSFVGTLAMVCLNSVSPIVQICVSVFGVRYVLIGGTILVALGLEMAGFSTQIWHLYLTQGVVFGTGASCIYVAIMGVAPQWFGKRRGLALA
ncbi:hypothetical protein G6F42_021115 [Rhizopus arrhizus]|nr:hypothetical protein G6F42_021115 [Rhizopus arrhizus]